MRPPAVRETPAATRSSAAAPVSNRISLPGKSEDSSRVPIVAGEIVPVRPDEQARIRHRLLPRHARGDELLDGGAAVEREFVSSHGRIPMRACRL